MLGWFKQRRKGMPVHLMQGVFFQRQDHLGLGHNAEGDLRVFVRSGMCRYMYSGVIFPDPDSVVGRLIGEMFDNFGQSILSDIQMSLDELRFVKKYNDRKDIIRYRFHRQGPLCVGGIRAAIM